MRIEKHPKFIPTNIVRSLILKKYSIRKIYKIKLIYALENAIWSINGKNKYILKIFYPANTVQKIEEEANLYQYLNLHNVNVPKVMPSKDSRTTTVLKFRTHNYPTFLVKLEKLRKVTPATITKEELFKIAKTVARMHKILLNYPQSLIALYEKSPMLVNYPNWDFYPQLRNSPNGRALSNQELNHLKKLSQKMNKYLQINFPPEVKLFSIIHSDIALGHAQFLPNGRVYLFDFSDRNWGPLIYELAVMLCHIYREGGITFKRWEKIKEWLLEGYQSVTIFPKIDLDALKTLIIRRLQGEIAYINEMSEKFGEVVNNEGQRNRYKLLEYLLKKI